MKRDTYIAILLAVVAAMYMAALPALQYQQSELAVVIQNTDAEENEDADSVSELTYDVVLPSFNFTFGVPSAVLIEPVHQFLCLYLPKIEVTRLLTPSSYFSKLFERTIAINAP